MRKRRYKALLKWKRGFISRLSANAYIACPARVCVCVCVCVCTEMAISWKVKQTVECFSSVSCAMALRSRRPGSKGPSCWAHAALPGPPGPYWSLEVKIPPPTHSRIFASQSVPERRIGVMRFLEQLVWMFSLIDSQFLQSFMLCPFSTLNTRIVKVNFKFRLSWRLFLALLFIIIEIL